MYLVFELLVITDVPIPGIHKVPHEVIQYFVKRLIDYGCPCSGYGWKNSQFLNMLNQWPVLTMTTSHICCTM